MAQLLYRTRGDVSPRDLPRVYFTCHGQDFQGCFEQTAKDILKISNCAIYYYEEEPELDEDYRLNLSRMNLMVIPVTARLLYLPNRAIDVELPYAREHHIPVLPLMQETGLEEKFNEKFGNLQFLNRYDTDPTAIPYGEKLKKYLDVVLIGDELAAKVRAAFDAYIFLSYRKKDRKLAQDLMKLIHRSPCCRDFAIWYDEFLTPGENFNDSIRAALEKSGLFLLAVTPNLVNETNYIMTTEYPIARASGKPILPAQMAQTDPEALRACFVDIPECIDPENQEQVSELLLNALRCMAIQENDRDAMHNFFIGLAYLTGIDVEVDHEYALKLITSAAENGLTEAMEKLVSMYESGEGVERNHMTAVSWRERIAEQARCHYEEIRSEQAGKAYLAALSQLAKAWKLVWDWCREIQTYEQICLLAQELFQRFKGDEFLYSLSNTYSTMGAVMAAQHNLSAAKAWYQKALEIGEGLKNSKKTGSLRLLQRRYKELGTFSLEEGDFEASKKWRLKALEIGECLAKNGSAEAIRDLRSAYNNMGYLARREENIAEAKDWYLKALALSETLAASQTVEDLLDLCRSYEILGRIDHMECNISGENVWYKKTLGILERLAEGRDPEVLRLQVRVYNTLGSNARLNKELDTAEVWYRKMLEADEKLAESGTMDSLKSLSRSYVSLGEIAADKKDISEAKRWYQKALVIHENLAQICTPGALRSLSDGYERMAYISQKTQNIAEQRKWTEKALEVFEQLAQNGTPKAFRELSRRYESMGDMFRAEELLSDAEEWYRKALKIYEKLAKDHDSRSLLELCRVKQNLGDIALKKKNSAEAEYWYRSAYELCGRVPGSEDQLKIRYLSNCCEKMGDVSRSINDIPAAKNWYLEAVNLREGQTVEAHYSRSAKKMYLRELAQCYEKLGMLAEICKDNSAALVWRGKARETHVLREEIK